MNKNKWLQNPGIVCLIASLCCALWGSAFPSVKIGYQMLGISASEISSQILFAGTRFTLSGIMVVLLGSILTGRIMLPVKGSFIKIFNLSLFQTVGQYVFFYIGLSHTSGVKGSIMEGFTVFAALLVASFLFRQEKLTGKKLIGCLIGFLGVVLVNLNSGEIRLDFSIMGEGFILISTIAYALSAALFKYYSQNDNAVMLSGYQFMTGGIIMMVIGFLTGGRMGNHSAGFVAVLLYLAFVSAVAYTLWGILLKYNPVSKVAVYGFMTPVFGVILSALLLKEKQSLSYKTFLALILVSVGIYIVNYNKQNNTSD